MKNNSFDRNFQMIPTDLKRTVAEKTLEKINFSSKAINTMTEQLVMPPARVWDKIERILDEQDDRRKLANTYISNSFKKLENSGNRKNLYIAAVAAAGLVAGIIWKAS